MLLDTISDWWNSFWSGATSWIENAFRNLWDWVRNAIADVYQTIHDALSELSIIVGAFLDPFKKWVIETIDNITENIRVWKYRFSLKFAAWMNDPIRFWLTIAGVVALVIALPSIGKYITSTKLWIAAVAIFDKIKQAGGKFLDKLMFIQLNAVNRVFLILNPDYKSYWAELDKAFMGMAEQIEIGVGTLNNITSSVRGLYYATYSLFGIDADTIETKFYDDATRFWSSAQSDWERYVRDPNQIFDDVQSRLIYPVLDDMAAAGVERAQHDLAVAKSLDETIHNINDVRVAFNSLVASLPDDLEAMVNAKIGPVMSSINSFFDITLMPFMSRVDDSIAYVEATIGDIQAAIYANSLRRPLPGDELIAVLFDGTLDLETKRKLMSEVFARILRKETDDFTDTLTIITHAVKHDDNYIPKVPEDTKPLPFKPLINITLSQIQASAEPWFVGEY